VHRHVSAQRLRVRRGAVAILVGALLLGVGAGAWALVGPGGATGADPTRQGRPTAPPPVTAGTRATGTPRTPAGTPGATPAGSPSASPSAAPSAAPSGSATSRPGLTAADVRAGLLKATFPQRGTGRLAVVEGSVPAPAPGRVVRVRVEVEGGLAVDGEKFADFALATLNDARSWAHDGRTFARTDGAADVRLVLASPATSAAMCRPLRTNGRLSCHSGGATVLTIYRWVDAIPGYGTDRTGYRRYLVNHEVGHALGHGHVSCPGRGRLAPVMMQQTKGLLGCRPNPWPYP
jgi:hypothetical protein